MKKQITKVRIFLDAEFKVGVPKEEVETLKIDISKGDASMSILISENIQLSADIYIDHFASGEMRISSFENGLVNFIAKGEAIFDLDHADLIEELKVKESIIVKCMYLCGKDCNNYFIDGDDQVHVVIGYCVLAS